MRCCGLLVGGWVGRWVGGTYSLEEFRVPKVLLVLEVLGEGATPPSSSSSVLGEVVYHSLLGLVGGWVGGWVGG